MHYRRATTAGGTYFFTVNLAERHSDLLVRHIEDLRTFIQRVKVAHPFVTLAMVVLPEHLHALWRLPPGDADYPLRWSQIKAGFSRCLPKGERLRASRKAKRERGIWQRRYCVATANREMLGFASSAQPTVLLEQAITELNLQEGGFAMFVPDMPNMPPQTPAIVMVAQTNQAQQNTPRRERAVGLCILANSAERRDEHGKIYPYTDRFSPLSAATSYVQEYEQRTNFSLTDEDVDSVKYTILKLPKHGTFIEEGGKRWLAGSYLYTPKVGYLGKDTAEVLVEVKGLKIKVVYFIHVLDFPAPFRADHWAECEKEGGIWKISSINNDPTGQLLSFNNVTQLTSYLAGAINANINIADLPDGALGQVRT